MQQTVIDMLARLVAFPTVSRDSNLALIEYVQTYLADHGVDSHLVRCADDAKANLYATIGPDRPGGVVLSGHTDVVPVDDQDWHSDPFTLLARNHRLYGRGTADMKAFLAIALALVPEMSHLARPVHLAFSYDEEIGCLGAPALIAALAERVAPPRAVIVGEPTGMQVVTAHKGSFNFYTHVRGHEAHSSLQHRGVSAVMVAGRLISWLAERQRANAEAAQPNDFEPGYTTLHCGQVRGGTAHNIMAGHCSFVTDIRALPGEDPLRYFEEYRAFAAELEREMRQTHPDTGIEFEIAANVPAFSAPDACGAVALATQLTGQNETVAQPYTAEAGQFQSSGFPVVMCGPGFIDQAHQPNEFISLEQLQAGTRFVRRIVALLSGLDKAPTATAADRPQA
jgi:acetylornithine deacetylase